VSIAVEDKGRRRVWMLVVGALLALLASPAWAAVPAGF